LGMAEMIVAEANAAKKGIESLKPHPILKMTA